MGDTTSLMSSAGFGAQVGGAISSVFGAYNQSRLSKAGYNAQAQTADVNAQLAEYQAQDALRRGQQAVNRQQLQTAALKGTQRASMAARGLDLTEGAPVSILSDTDYMGAVDANTLQDNAMREAWGYRVQESNYTANAGVLRARADAESQLTAGVSTLLTSAGGVADRWYSNKKAGVPGPWSR